MESDGAFWLLFRAISRSHGGGGVDGVGRGGGAHCRHKLLLGVCLSGQSILFCFCLNPKHTWMKPSFRSSDGIGYMEGNSDLMRNRRSRRTTWLLVSSQVASVVKMFHFFRWITYLLSVLLMNPTLALKQRQTRLNNRQGLSMEISPESKQNKRQFFFFFNWTSTKHPHRE